MLTTGVNAGVDNRSAFKGLSADSVPLAGWSWQRKVAAIFLLSAAIQLLAGWLLFFRADVHLLDYDEQEYWTLSGQMLAGIPMELGRRTILFPLVLTGLRSIWDNLWFVQCCVALGAAAAPPLLAVLVKKTTGSELAALIAGIAFACWPAQIFYSSSLYSELWPSRSSFSRSYSCPAASTERATPDGGSGRPSARRWVSPRTSGQCTSCSYPYWRSFSCSNSRRIGTSAARFAMIAAGFAAVVLPWSVYVSRELGSPVLLSANGGETLAGGFNPKIASIGEHTAQLAKRTTWYGPGKWMQASDTGYLSAKELSLPYVAQDRLLRARTLGWISEDPATASYLALRKFTYMWGIYPLRINGWRQLVFGNIPVILLSLAFIWTLISMPMVRRRCARLYLLPLFVTGVGLISWGSWRFRLPGDAGIIGVVAILVAARFNMWRQAPTEVGA